MKNEDWLVPDWEAPPNVQALVTTRSGGVSSGAYESMNFGLHVGDAVADVMANRACLRAMLPSEPVWLEQVHGTTVAAADHAVGVPCADASVARRPGTVCMVMTADCLPVLLCDVSGTVVAAAHAGWRGLAAGVLEATVAAMNVSPGRLLAWLGPAIGPTAFEVGDEVRREFVDDDPMSASAFVAGVADGKSMADIFALARLRLERAGVRSISGGGLCTVGDPARFYSYRRDHTAGRFGSMVWLSND